MGIVCDAREEADKYVYLIDSINMMDCMDQSSDHQLLDMIRQYLETDSDGKFDSNIYSSSSVTREEWNVICYEY